MVIPWDEELAVHPQAENFTKHQVWDFEGTDEDHYPLLLHFPYFDLYRKQVVKQADLVMAMVTRGDAFTDEEKARNFAYYEPLTVRDSSLSACVQAMMAAETGHLELAYDYFGEAALMDLDDLEHNTRDGVHIASLAGAWVAAVGGFGGLRDHDGELSFSPRLPERLTKLSFRLSFRGCRIKVAVTHHEAEYSLLDGAPFEISHHGKRFKLKADKPVRHKIPDLPERQPVSQPPGRAPMRRGTKSASP
jgi:alpha,alpha-trehalose phosphorylase